MDQTAQPGQTQLESFIAEAKSSGGSELANYQIFTVKLCDALGLSPPAMAKEDLDHNDYVFERRISFNHPDGTSTGGRIEAKQSP